MKYLNKLGYENIGQILWFSIKTKPLEGDITAESKYFPAWAQKVAWDDNIKENEAALNRYELRAGLYKEFSQISEISYGRVDSETGTLTIKKLSTEIDPLQAVVLREDILTEKDIIEQFYKDVQNFVAGGVKFLGGFMINSFSIPFVSFRAMVNGIEEIPSFDIAGLKTWDIKHTIDVNELLRGTSMTNISLLGAATAFDLPEYDDERTEHTLFITVNLFAKYLRKGLIPNIQIVGKKEEVTEKLPLLQRIFNSAILSDEIKKDLQEKITKHELSEKEKKILEKIICAHYLSKSDKAADKKAKKEEVKNFIESL